VNRRREVTTLLDPTDGIGLAPFLGELRTVLLGSASAGVDDAEGGGGFGFPETAIGNEGEERRYAEGREKRRGKREEERGCQWSVEKIEKKTHAKMEERTEGFHRPKPT
jgi:hypothetical protein